MVSDDRPHFDTAAYFVRSKFQGTLMPDLDGTDMNAWNRYWQAHPMRVRNARLMDPSPTLESHGFELIRFTSEVNEHHSIGERLQLYDAENRRIVENVCDCRESRCLNVVVRGGFKDRSPGDSLGQTESEFGTVYNYARYVHTDVSPFLEIQPLWNAFANKRHCAIYNVWRNINLSTPIEQMPLAVCDLRSVDQSNMVAACVPGLLPDGNRMIGYNLVHNLFQSWYYYPHMTHNEALVFKLYDTREPKCSLRGVFHTSVFDPDASTDALRRESLDMRVGVVFEHESDYDARRAQYLADLPPIPNEFHPKTTSSSRQTSLNR